MKLCIFSAFAVFSLLAVQAQGAPVTGWVVVSPTTGAPATTKPLSGANTASPVLGNGSEDSAATVAMYADISGSLDGAADVALANGQRVTLTGSATLSGIISAMEQFRWGLFNESASPFDTSGWVGFIASNSAGSGGGALRAKPSESGTFAQTGSAVNIKTSQDGDDFINETYYFSMSVSCFNNEVSVDASLTSADDWTQVWKDVVVTAPTPLTFNFNRAGFLAGGGMHANLITFSDIDVTAEPVETLTLQVITTGPDAGAVQIRNNRSEAFEIEYYEIISAGSLNAGSWNSLDDQEDGDPDLEGWEESRGNGVKLLSEYRLFSTTTVEAQTSLSLGHAFNVGANQDLKFFVGLADGTFARGVVEYVDSPVLTGDYNNDGQIDAADYVMWRKNENSSDILPNDAVGGPIGFEQYDRWRENFGESASGAGGVDGQTPVPEPRSMIFATLGALALFACRRRTSGSPVLFRAASLWPRAAAFGSPIAFWLADSRR